MFASAFFYFFKSAVASSCDLMKRIRPESIRATLRFVSNERDTWRGEYWVRLGYSAEITAAGKVKR